MKVLGLLVQTQMPSGVRQAMPICRAVGSIWRTVLGTMTSQAHTSGGWHWLMNYQFVILYLQSRAEESGLTNWDCFLPWRKHWELRRERSKHLYYQAQQFTLGFSPDVIHRPAEAKPKGLVSAFPIFTKAEDHGDDELKLERWPCSSLKGSWHLLLYFCLIGPPFAYLYCTFYVKKYVL